MLSNVLIAVCIILAVPVLILFAQVVFSLIPRKPVTNSGTDAGSVVVLIPAHNEEEVIADTISSVLPHLGVEDSILVIADNCSDQTQQVAENLGVETVPRENFEEIGKGFAIDFGISYLSKINKSFEVLIILDADCVIESGSLRGIASDCVTSGRPVQGLYLMRASEKAGIGEKVAELAWLVKSFVRSRGYSLLGLPCQLAGSGMAFPKKLVDAGQFHSGSIVEDLELGVNLTMNGYAPKFYSELRITSTFPTSNEGLKSQRQRWEHGHIASIFRLVPKLVKKAIEARDFDCLALALDIVVPPLALLSIFVLALNIVSFANLAFGGNSIPAVLSGSLLVMLILGVLIAWIKFGRDILSAKDLFYIPVYMLKKLPIYARFLFHRQQDWVKTPRQSQYDEKDE
jgi:cellulose synthase/poly-beta-1,6-N-acetylglucosamine synthase-like glycosyltransferase